MRYAWAMSIFKDKADPNEVAAYIKELIQKHEGVLTPEDILDSSRATQSPLYRCFDWEESVAARKWNIGQAARIVNSLVVARGRSKTRTRAFVYIAVPTSPGARSKRLTYVDVRDAMRDPELADEVVANALKELTRWIGRYGANRSLNFVASTVESLRRKIQAEIMANTAGV